MEENKIIEKDKQIKIFNKKILNIIIFIIIDINLYFILIA